MTDSSTKDRTADRLHATLDRLQRENELLRAAIERLPHGMCMFDANDRLLLANARYLELWNLPKELGRPGTPFSAIMSVTRGYETEKSRANPPITGKSGTRHREWRLEDGRTIEVVVARQADGSCVAVHEDVTARREADTQIAFLAQHDMLTGLPNRATLMEGLDRALSHAPSNARIAVLFLDLDRFKPVNESLGHTAGDSVLRAVAERLRRCVRDSDLVVRLGGDEFAVVQTASTQPAAATTLAQRIIGELSRPIEFNNQTIHTGASIGIAISPSDGADSKSLLRSADVALYRAKNEGRGTFRCFEPDMDAQVRARSGLDADLRRALTEDQFELHYQPQVSARDFSVSNFEALLRWRHPTRGMVPPNEFIAFAEETGLIVAIGRWVLQCACRDASRWPEHVGVAVNVSAVQFKDGSLVGDVVAALEASELHATRLEIEITESVMLQNTQQALAQLNELRKLGVRVAMDDFGTGYSSLSYLRSFPFDRIKIDRTFVRDVTTNPDTLAIIRAVASLGSSLGMRTTVEGVETQLQLQAVIAEGCNEIQGFFFSRPQPVTNVAALIADIPQLHRNT